MSGIFISYRRDDSAGHAGRLFDRLREQFGAGNVAAESQAQGAGARVFMDVEGIAPGTDFVKAIHNAVDGSDVVLAVIGSGWLDCQDAQGRRRLDDAEDFVRLEIASALRLNKVVIPVLVHEAEMPLDDALPDELKPLARRQAVMLTDTNWESDFAQLVSSLRSLMRVPALQPPTENFWTRLVRVLSRPVPIALVIALAAGAYAWRAMTHSRTDISLERASTAEPKSSIATPAPVNERQAYAQPEAARSSLGAALRASSKALDFGTLRMGSEDVQVVRIVNRGMDVAEISRMGFTGEAGADYSMTHQCGEQIAPDGSCDVRIRFAPSEPGARQSLLSVEYYGRNSPLIVKLWGEGASKGSKVSRAAVSGK
jgi:hypothetical protein